MSFNVQETIGIRKVLCTMTWSHRWLERMAQTLPALSVDYTACACTQQTHGCISLPHSPFLTVSYLMISFPCTFLNITSTGT